MGAEQFTEHIMKFDLTRQEAVVYECLLTNGKLTGYEAAKITGISRSNVYGTLASLCEKGAAHLAEEINGRKYIAVMPQEFCENKIDQLKMEEDWIVMHAPAQKTEEEGYITVAGPENIRSKVKTLLAGTKERVYVSGSREFLEFAKPELERLWEEGKKVVVITDSDTFSGPGKIYRTKEKKQQIGMITDSRFVLSGEFGEGTQNTCLYSGQRNFAELFKEAMANEIKLIELTEGEK